LDGKELRIRIQIEFDASEVNATIIDIESDGESVFNKPLKPEDRYVLRDAVADTVKALWRLEP